MLKISIATEHILANVWIYGWVMMYRIVSKYKIVNLILLSDEILTFQRFIFFDNKRITFSLKLLLLLYFNVFSKTFRCGSTNIGVKIIWPIGRISTKDNNSIWYLTLVQLSTNTWAFNLWCGRNSGESSYIISLCINSKRIRDR